MDKAIDQLEKIVLPNSNDSVTFNLKLTNCPLTVSQGDGKATPELTSVVRVLMGISEVSGSEKINNITFFDESLNQSQRDAIKFAMESKEVACIHGPPGKHFFGTRDVRKWAFTGRTLAGTGKTHTLIEIIRQLTSVTPANPKPLRLLICGASNLSVDNILERLLALPAPTNGGKLKITRVGHPARVMAHGGVLDATLEIKASRSDQVCMSRMLEALFSVCNHRPNWLETSNKN